MATIDLEATRTTMITTKTGFLQVLNSEWIKFRSLRTNLWALVAAAVVSIGVGAVFTVAHLEVWTVMSEAERARVDPVLEGFIGFGVFGILGFAVLGALAMTAEYSSSTIASTFAAVPRRLHVLGAKVLVAGGVTLVFATVTALATFFLAQPILARESMNVSLGDDGVLLAVIGGGVYCAGAALIGLALGAIIRHTAATLVAVTTVFSLATIVAQAQPESWATVTKYLPHSAGLAAMASIESPELLSPFAGLLVLAGWTVAGLVIAAILLQRRDVNA
jgi:ABC-2 type transport system permease protein